MLDSFASTSGQLDSHNSARAAEVLSGHSQKRGLKRLLPFLGPAVIASIAYIDPGNFATNIQGGADFGYRLLWVILAANLMAMLIQNLSANLGIATGKNLPQVIREQWPTPVKWFYWVQAEIVAMATDLAEFIGASIAIHLLTGLSLFWGAVVTAIISFWILSFQRRGARPMELVIGAFVLIIGLAYLAQFVMARPALSALGAGFIPSFAGTQSVYLAVGIIGATVMPHAIFLHSGLTQDRVPGATLPQRRRLVRYSNVEVIVALAMAFLAWSLYRVRRAALEARRAKGAGAAPAAAPASAAPAP